MTYCVGLRLNQGLVFMSDTRTNAGVDDIATVKKMHTWQIEGERVITLMTAGNLATTQALVSLLDERSKVPEDRNPSILAAPTMFQVARLIGDTLKEVIQANSDTGQSASSAFNATLILGGQIKGMSPRLFLIYPEGNFIEAENDTPFFQIGETKYGRPILVRAQDPDMSFEDAVKLLIVSFDSTIKANLSVGLPLDLMTYEADSLTIGVTRRFNRDDKYVWHISNSWGKALKKALKALPDFEFDDED
ncbi:peptidase [Litorimonas sp. RW-G-Af-16]|uniref:peptidase n=1 Tax=Litorimonas sp. RW-G-Af-16 TaxID=3241168 RepID=UPI00390CD36D